MRTLSAKLYFCVGVLISSAVSTLSACATPAPAKLAEATVPNPPPATDLAFADFYRMPIGPTGLEPTEKLLALEGQRVRLRGYMAHEDEPYEGVFMMAMRPIALAERSDGPADDLPAATAFVHLPTASAHQVPVHLEGPIEVDGLLQLGQKEETNGRVSYVRVLMDSNSIRRLQRTAQN